MERITEYDQLKAQRNRAYIGFGLALGLAAAEALALRALAPLKTVEPVFVTVDAATQHVVVQNIDDPKSITAKTAYLQGKLYEYVTWRNTVDPADRDRLYKLVGLHSCGDADAEYRREMSPDNPENPYREGLRRTVQVMSPTLLDENTAQVRFKTTTRRAAGIPKEDYWSALIKFGWSRDALPAEDTWQNPFKFCVINYRRDQESGGS